MAAAPEGRFVSGGTRTFRSLPDGTWVEGVSTPPHSGLPGCQCLDCGRVVAAAVKAALERVRDRLRAHDEDAYEQMGYDDVIDAALAALAPEGTA